MPSIQRIWLGPDWFGCAPEKPQEGLILGRSGGSRTETVRNPASLASQGVSSLGDPASRRRGPFYCGSGDGPDELSSAFSFDRSVE